VRAFLALVALTVAAPVARAQDADAPSADAPSVDDGDDDGDDAAQPPPREPPAPAPHREWSLELGGRVFVRDTVSRIDVGDGVWRHERAIDQARVSASYERKRLRLELEVDFAGDDATLKDTYIRLEPAKALRVQAGRFKVPMSFLGRESKWRIPSIERGLLSELELDDRDLPFAGGRAEGLAIELRPRVALEPRVTAALFQSPLASGLAPVDPSEDVTQDLYARAEIEPISHIHLAAGFAMVGYDEQLGVADTFRHLALGSVELHADTRHLRAWLEGFAGQSFAHQSNGASSGAFLAARALVSPRLRKPGAGIYRIEPYAGGSLFDPTDEVDGDRVSEVVAGVNVAFSRHWRVQIEGAQRVAEGLASPVADSTLIRVQLGAAFEERVE